MYLKAKHPECKNVYAIGKECLAEELRLVGFQVVSSQEHNEKYGNFSYHDIGSMSTNIDVDAVVQGYDDNVNLYKLCYASFCIQQPNVRPLKFNVQCVYIATNPDMCTMTKSNLLCPGNGAFVQLLETASNKKSVCSGKPNSFCFETIVKKLAISKKDILFIGDNLRTDILFSNDSGVDSLLVMTGVTTPKRLEDGIQEGDGKPTFIANNLSLVKMNI